MPMGKERISEERCNQIRNALHLKVNSGTSPFELSEGESRYGPDDWAWSFLRLSGEYEQSYNAHADSDDVDLSHALIGPQPLGIKHDSDGTCAEDFGLAAWVPPWEKELPKFVEKDDSWFFPLKRPIAEDYRRIDVSELHHSRPWSRYSPILDKYPHILANETSFGYRAPPSVPIPILQRPRSPRKPYSQYLKAPPPFSELTLGLVWVAVDCSLPPHGQLSALGNLAQVMRDALRAEGWKSRRNTRYVDIQDVEKSDAFAHIKFRYAGRPARELDDYKPLWRAVMIDSLASIKLQQKELRRTLTKIHLELIANEQAQQPSSLRFRNTLSFGIKSGGGPHRVSRGGSYLKALIILAHIVQHGYTELADIARILGLHSLSGRYVGDWARHFDADLKLYIDDALTMVHSDYRSLVHEQKPDI